VSWTNALISGTFIVGVLAAYPERGSNAHSDFGGFDGYDGFDGGACPGPDL
jgi:hypothetical protein